MYLCRRAAEIQVTKVRLKIETIAEDFGVHRRSIMRWRNRLVELGLLEVERRQYGMDWIIPTVTCDTTTFMAHKGDPDVTLANPRESTETPVVTEETKETVSPPDVTSLYKGNVNRNVEVTSYLGNEDRCVKETSSLGNVNRDVNKRIPLSRKKATKVKKEKPPRTNANFAPSLPAKASETEEVGNNFPYLKTGLNTSSVWYWAIRRWRLYGLDTEFTQTGFRKMNVLIQNNIVVRLQKNWKRIKHYIDWYLTSPDKFIVKDCNRGFEYLSSTHCLNKYLAEFPKLKTMMILTDEERKTTGKWIKS
jgi:hypothetical protein